MENLLALKKERDFITEISNLYDLAEEISGNRYKTTLVSVVNYVDCNPFNNNIINCEFSDKLTYEIARKLAIAIDKNSTDEIKLLKSKYGKLPQFTSAKDFLNRKCKILWDVIENKSKKMKLPYDAMKTLGISNMPDLSYMLDYSIKYYEKNNGKTTSEIINSILNNPNLDYTFNDIFEYLVKQKNKLNIDYSITTLKYVLINTEFNTDKSIKIGITRNKLYKIYKQFSFKDRVKNLPKFIFLFFNIN